MHMDNVPREGKRELGIGRLKNSTEEQEKMKPEVKWGAYKFPDDPQPYCQRCWNKYEKKNPTERQNSTTTKCGTCGNVANMG